MANKMSIIGMVILSVAFLSLGFTWLALEPGADESFLFTDPDDQGFMTETARVSSTVSDNTPGILYLINYSEERY